MIVIGADTHKHTHTTAAVNAATGELLGELTATARTPGFTALLDWGRSLDSDRIWAIEDCRHVSGSFERYLVARGERVIRVAPKLMGQSRRASAPAASQIRSMQSPSPGRRSSTAPGPFPRPTSTRRPCRSSSCSIIARTSFAAAQTISSACAGTCTTSGPTTRPPPAPWTGSSGSIGSPAASPAPSSQPGS